MTKSSSGRIRKLFLWFCLILLVLVGLAFLVARLAFNLNLLDGTFTYDPRTQKPADWISSNAPETFVYQYLQQQIAQNGTYPTNATSKVASLEPIKVVLGTYTDWMVGADVTVNILYQNGTSRQEHFGMQSGSDKGFEFGPIAFSYGAEFGPISGCKEYEPFKSSCNPP